VHRTRNFIPFRKRFFETLRREIRIDTIVLWGEQPPFTPIVVWGAVHFLLTPHLQSISAFIEGSLPEDVAALGRGFFVLS